MKYVIRQTQAIGDSLYVGIPSNIAKELHIEKGDSLCIDVENNKMIVAHLPISTPASVPANIPNKEVSA